MLKVAIAGSSGRMGRTLIEAVLASTDCTLTGALDVAASPALGQDAGAFAGRATGVAITDHLRTGLAGADVLIDFTRPEGTLAHLAVCRELGVKAVIGTTGFSPAQKEAIAEHARHIAIVRQQGIGESLERKVLRRFEESRSALFSLCRAGTG